MKIKSLLTKIKHYNGTLNNFLMYKNECLFIRPLDIDSEILGPFSIKVE